jgi:predicted Zn-dependent protease with MMP-like domain
MGPGLPDLQCRFDEYAQDALESLPSDLRARMSNVEIVIEEESPAGHPDKITIFRGPLVRLYGHRPETLRREVRRVVLHEVAHHFGISDERLLELDRY